MSPLILMKVVHISEIIEHLDDYCECKICGKINLTKNNECIACGTLLKAVSLDESGTMNGYLSLFSEDELTKITIEV